MAADPAGNSILFNLLLLLFFTLLNAFFAGAEMAVVSVNKNRIRSMADEGNKKAKVMFPKHGQKVLLLKFAKLYVQGHTN